MRLQLGTLRLRLPLDPDGHIRQDVRSWFETAGIPLEKAQKGGMRANHKYIRRIPNPSGKGYRYIYSEAGTAHAAQEGERLNLRSKGLLDVLGVDGDRLQVRDVHSGETLTITLAELHEAMHAAWRDRFERGAERMVRRFIAEAEIKKDGEHYNNPKALDAAYAERFRRAKVDRETAERLATFVAGRKGWEMEAKAALLALASHESVGRVVAPRARQIGRGSENLAKAEGKAKVTARHVGSAAAIVVGNASGFDEHLAELRAKAREELGRATVAMGAIDAAGNNVAARKAMLAYAHTVFSQSALQELETASLAFPGLRDLDELTQLRDLHGRWHAATKADAPSTGLGAEGAATFVYVANADGAPTPQKSRYRLIDAGKAIASHDVQRNFAANPNYPEGVQERAYHRDKAEQQKVRANAQGLEPAYVLNTNPDAVNGPPVITSDGIVLGGNSRTMSIQLAYAQHPDKAKAYKQHLAEHAHEFGFTPGDVEGMEQPMLVREVEIGDHGADNLGVLVRRYNENFTQAMDPRTDQVARGRMVHAGMLSMLASAMDELGPTGEPKFPTLGAYLSSSQGRHFVNELASGKDGKSIIDRRNRSMYVGKDGRLNEDGKVFVERVLVGHVISDADLLSEMQPSQVSALARSVPHIVRAQKNGHDYVHQMREALYAHAYMRRHGLSRIEDYESTQTLGDFANDAGFGTKPQLDAGGKVLLDRLVNRPGPVQMSGFFSDVARKAQHNPANQMTLTGEKVTINEILQQVHAGPSRGEQTSLFKALLIAQAAAEAWQQLQAQSPAMVSARHSKLPVHLRKAVSPRAWRAVVRVQAPTASVRARGALVPISHELAKGLESWGCPVWSTPQGSWIRVGQV